MVDILEARLGRRGENPIKRDTGLFVFKHGSFVFLVVMLWAGGLVVNK